VKKHKGESSGIRKVGGPKADDKLSGKSLNQLLDKNYTGIGIFPSHGACGKFIKSSDIKKNTNKKPIDKCDFIYSEYVKYRAIINEKFGTIKKLEFFPVRKMQQILHKVKDDNIDYDIVRECIGDYIIGFTKNFGELGQFESCLYKTCDKLLDFGSGNGDEWLLKLTKEYYTLDIDPKYNTTFAHIDEIPDDLKFNAIVTNQVFEHIEKEKLPNIAKKLSSLLAPGGKMMVSVPNVHNWYHYLCDFDHKSPLMYWDIAALFEMNGITVTDIYFYTKVDKYVALQDELSDPVNLRLHQFMADYYYLHPADYLVVVGEKNNVKNII
jgi:predicted SAM-dependent methyltransferase